MAVTNDEAKARERREQEDALTWTEVDFRLSLMLDLLFGTEDDNPDGSASLTLVTQGATISGTVVSTEKYEEGLAEGVEENSPVMASAIRAQNGAIAEARARNRAADKAASLTPLRSFAHFSEATVMSGSTRLQVKNLRVSLRDVSAWTLGAMS